jgi:hypothetical protein
MAVCVRMVSEGVDVPRAACLAWMTSYRTPLFFAQGVGRVVRARNSGESATVFLPAVRPLLALAAELELERNHVIPPPSAEDESLLDVERAEPEPGEGETNELVDADAAFAHVLHAGRAVVAEPSSISEEDEDFLGLPGILSPEQMATVLARRDIHARRRASTTTPAPPSAETLAWRSGAELRREVNRLVGIVAARHGQPHGQVHSELRRIVPGPPSAAASVEILEQRRDHLMSRLGT